MGDLGLRRACVIELPAGVGPAQHLLDVAGGIDPVIAGKGIGVEDDTAIGIDRLMDLVLQLLGRSSLLRQRGIRIRAAAMTLIRYVS